MGVTSRLLKLYRVDQQLRGLQARLRSAEAYLFKQDKLLKEIETRTSSMRSLLRQSEATMHNDETEIKSIDERLASLKARMAEAQTMKEHHALQTELGTFKADRAIIEERVLEAMSKVDELKQQLQAAGDEQAERGKLRKVAESDRQTQADKIKDRVNELQSERETAVKDVPAQALTLYQDAIERGIEDIMAPIEEHDRRNMEYTCGSCYTHLPIEKVSILLKRGDLTTCPSCDAVLYIDNDLKDSISSSKPNARTRRTIAVNGL